MPQSTRSLLPTTSAEDVTVSKNTVGALAQITKVLFLGASMIIISAMLISFNKYLVSGGFPYPTQLVMIHTGFGSVVSGLMFKLKPSLFPALNEGTVDVGRDMMLKKVLPVAILFAGHLVLSNSAYFYSSVAFLQMIKESNVVLVYALSVFAALEEATIKQTAVLVMIVFATTLTIHGEIHFSLMGLLLQGSSLLCESIKIVVQTLMLSNSGKKLDPLSYVLLVSPISFIVLGVSLFGGNALGAKLPIASFANMYAIWPLLAANASVAFMLNCVMAAFIQASSGIGFVLAGITKDVFIVLAGVFVMQEAISRQQAFGFFLQIKLIFLWAMMKTFPEQFKKGVLSGFVQIVLGKKSTKGGTCSTQDDEKSALLAAEKTAEPIGAAGKLLESK